MSESKLFELGADLRALGRYLMDLDMQSDTSKKSEIVAKIKKHMIDSNLSGLDSRVNEVIGGLSGSSYKSGEVKVTIPPPQLYTFTIVSGSPILGDSFNGMKFEIPKGKTVKDLYDAVSGVTRYPTKYFTIYATPESKSPTISNEFKLAEGTINYPQANWNMIIDAKNRRVLVDYGQHKYGISIHPGTIMKDLSDAISKDHPEINSTLFVKYRVDNRFKSWNQNVFEVMDETGKDTVTIIL